MNIKTAKTTLNPTFGRSATRRRSSVRSGGPPLVRFAASAVATLSLIAAGAASLGSPAVAASVPASSGQTTRVSVSKTGVEGNFDSSGSSISADGRYVAFASYAGNLVSRDTNGASDVFVKDRVTGAVERLSATTRAIEGNGDSYLPAISSDGRFVVFVSEATNLVRHDTNGAADVFIKNRASGTIRRVSVSSTWKQARGWSQLQPSISAQGRYVAFSSTAANLVPGDTNKITDVFVRDRVARTTERVSVSTGGQQADDGSYLLHPSLSSDGRFVVFSSNADNLVPGDTNSAGDVFIRDRVAQTTRRVSVTSAGGQAPGEAWSAGISANGRFVTFSTGEALVPQDTNGTWDVYLWNQRTHRTERVSIGNAGVQGNGSSLEVAGVSSNGRYVAFTSDATNLTPEPASGLQLFLRDRSAGTTEMVSVNDSDAPALTDGVELDSISAEGRYVTFSTDASNLVPGDTNNTWDVFVRDMGPCARSTLTHRQEGLGG